jgi:hypothetical protein
VTHLIRENQAGSMPAGQPFECVLVVACDPQRRKDLAQPFSGAARVIEARSPLEGLWTMPDAQAVVIDRGDEIELVHLTQGEPL